MTQIICVWAEDDKSSHNSAIQLILYNIRGTLLDFSVRYVLFFCRDYNIIRNPVHQSQTSNITFLSKLLPIGNMGPIHCCLRSVSEFSLSRAWNRFQISWFQFWFLESKNLFLVLVITLVIEKKYTSIY